MDKKSSKTNLIVSGIALFIFSFSAGYFTNNTISKKNQNISFNRQEFGQGQGLNRMQGEGARGGNMAQGQGRNAFQPTSGEIINMDEKSITVKTSDGGSKIILLTDSTKFAKSTEIQKTELKTGDTVGVFGQTNNDGSLTAQTLELNPSFNGRTAKALNQ